MTATAPPTPRPQQPTPGAGATWAPVTDFALSELSTAAGQGLQLWGVARVAASTWTVIAGTSGLDAVLDLQAPWAETICSVVQRSPEAVLVADLRRRRDPVLHGAFARWGLRAYVGAPLSTADGTRVGSLCGWSLSPAHDDEALRERVTQHARFLGRQLTQELHRTDAERRRDWRESTGTQDSLTRLADRQAWGSLLQREDDRGRWLADPAEVTLVDVSTTGSARAFKRLAGALVDAVGEGGRVARIGPRQFGVLSDGAQAADGGAGGSPADRVVEQVTSAAAGVRTGRAVRRGQVSMADVWVQAEADLLLSRRRST